MVRHQDVAGELSRILNELSVSGVNIANMSLNRDRRGGAALTVVETDQKIPADALERIRALYGVLGATYYERRKTEMALDSMQEIFDKIQAGRKPFWQVVLDTDVEERQVTAEASFEKMRRHLAGHGGVGGHLPGGPAQRQRPGGRRRPEDVGLRRRQETLCGHYMQEVIATALCVGSPTPACTGSWRHPRRAACGVLPAVLVPLYRRGAVDEEAIVRALYVAAGIGAVVGYRASIAGASGGCQAEVGTAAAMAAGPWWTCGAAGRSRSATPWPWR